jgi:hypothetical protein
VDIKKIKIKREKYFSFHLSFSCSHALNGLTLHCNSGEEKHQNILMIDGEFAV